MCLWCVTLLFDLLYRPTIQLPCASKAVVAVRFCPIFFKLRGKNLGICVLSILIFYEELLYIMVLDYTVTIELPEWSGVSLNQSLHCQLVLLKILPILEKLLFNKCIMLILLTATGLFNFLRFFSTMIKLGNCVWGAWQLLSQL